MPYATNNVVAINVFAYGTLLCEDIMEKIAGPIGKAQPAFAKGFSRYAIQNEAYPAIIPEADGVVSGIIYEHLSQAALEAIDAYEGAWYQRRPISVSLTNRSTLTAYAYVLLPAYYGRLAKHDWSYDEFCRDAKAHYLASL